MRAESAECTKFKQALMSAKPLNHNSYDRFACNLLCEHVYASRCDLHLQAQTTPDVTSSGEEAATVTSGAGAPCTVRQLLYVGTTEFAESPVACAKVLQGLVYPKQTPKSVINMRDLTVSRAASIKPNECLGQ